MKNILLFIIFFGVKIINSQNCKYQDEIDKLEKAIIQQEQDVSMAGVANLSQMQSEIAKYKNLCESEKNEKRTKSQNEFENNEVLRRNQEELRRNKEIKDIQKSTPKFKPSYNELANDITNGLNDISNSLTTIANNRMISVLNKEFDRRAKVENKYFTDLKNRFEVIDEMMNKIQNESLYYKLKDGFYTASFIEKKQFSFSKNNEVLNEERCIVYIEDEVVKELYFHGFKELKSNLTEKFSKQCKIVGGIVKIQDFETLKQYSIIIFEPFVNPDYKEPIVVNGSFGEISLWTSNKKDDGKPIFIQVLDKNGYIKREIETKLLYAKNEKDANQLVVENKVVIESGVKLLFFTQPMTSYFGFYSMYPRISKSDLEVLKPGEYRLIKVKDYMEP